MQAEWQQSPLQCGSDFAATQQVNALRAHVARKSHSQNGLSAAVSSVCTPTKWIVTLSVCFLRIRPFSLQVQRMSANRPSCRNVHGAASVAIRPCCRMSLTAQSRLSTNGQDAATRPNEGDIRACRSILSAQMSVCGQSDLSLRARNRQPFD
jgi:hypothetical protein